MPTTVSWLRLFLIRHADAVANADDAARELSAFGREQTRVLVTFFVQNAALDPAEWWCSPLIRARETAAYLAQGLKSAARVVETEGLLPEDDPVALLPRIARQRRSVAIVGHEPFLSALASQLVTGSPRPPVFHFQKSTVLCLEGAGDSWAVQWQVSPDLVRPAEPAGRRTE